MLDNEIHLMKAVESKHWWYRAKDDLLLRLWPESAVGPVLDIGCGTGRFLTSLDRHLREAGVSPELHGLDASAVSVGYADAGARFQVRSGSAESTGYPDGFFGVVVASDILEHLENDNAGIKEIYRILKPGGYLLLTVPAYQWLFSRHDIALSHKRRYNRRTLATSVTSADFEIKQLGYYFALLLPLLIIQRLLFKFRDSFLPNRNLNNTVQRVPPGLINKLLLLICALERRFLNLPFGSTVYCLARKY